MFCLPHFFLLRGWKSERASVLTEEDVEEKIKFLGKWEEAALHKKKRHLLNITGGEEKYGWTSK